VAPAGVGNTRRDPSARRRRIQYLLATAVVGLAVLLVVWASIGSGVFAHSACLQGAPVVHLRDYYIPAVLANAPFGGEVWGNGSEPASFPGAWNGPPPSGVSVSWGTGASNGGAAGSFFTVNVTVYSVHNATPTGIGTGQRCTEAYVAVLGSPDVYAEAGVTVQGPNNTSDQAEPTFSWLYSGTPGAYRTLVFNNSFDETNAAQISTCGGPARSVSPVTSDYLDLAFPVTIGPTNVSVPYALSISESYHYWFPADFGTWEIDDLAAGGGPGGGWAFSYSPCP
jgi:hypothetical protein